MAELDIERLEPWLAAWIQEGNPVRDDPSDAYAGMCGAKTGQGHICRTGAGVGTPHKGIGRCFHHPDVKEGLPPWMGTLSPEDWRRVAGGTAERPGQATHGATDFGLLSLDQLFERHLTPEENAVFRQVPSNPIQVLDFIVKLRVVALSRVNHYVAQQRAASQGPIAFDKTAGAEMLADKISTTIVRAKEVRARLMEVQSGNEGRDMLRDMLGKLSDEDFARLKNDPAALAQIAALSVPPTGAF